MGNLELENNLKECILADIEIEIEKLSKRSKLDIKLEKTPKKCIIGYTGFGLLPISSIVGAIKTALKQYDLKHENIEINSYYDALILSNNSPSGICQVRLNAWFGKSLILRVL